jgi:hypothetical protein
MLRGDPPPTAGCTVVYTPLSIETTPDKAFCRRTDFANLLVCNQGLQCTNNLGSLIWQRAQLRFSEEGMEHSEVCVPEL